MVRARGSDGRFVRTKEKRIDYSLAIFLLIILLSILFYNPIKRNFNEIQHAMWMTLSFFIDSEKKNQTFQPCPPCPKKY